MPPASDLDDDYVARLLAEDAKKTSHKYASQGLSAFQPKRRAADVLKPNTRFLSHIVREADHHNAALKRKEEQESERRLRALRDGHEPPRKRLRADESDQSKRSRMLKDILGATQQDSSGKHRSAADESRSSRDHRDGGKAEQKHSRRHRSRERHRLSDGSRRYQRRNSPSPSEDENVQQRRKRHKSAPRERSVNVEERNRHQRPLPVAASRNPSQLDGTISDGEEAVQKKRGRGAHRARPGIDEHFARSYDPSQDVSLDSDHDSDAEDWDLALEAMRDRAKWKRNQASRMREAGFDENQISKMENSFLVDDSHDGNRSSVKWSSKGEVREWDAGKVQ
ncbi:hypothetical protein PMZ80_007435 [Knufia obscura]|uniref:Pre-mRNA-splicing factor 38B n=1 Tax=Knufia obscura TaxID=1635080 RepID=A0ABR0RHB8_9EURO|nr:hypothetical protein PMZ80_007435 [Knufia obscura]